MLVTAISNPRVSPLASRCAARETINYPHPPFIAPYIVDVDAMSGRTRLYLRPMAPAFAASVARARGDAAPAGEPPRGVRAALRIPKGLLGGQAGDECGRARRGDRGRGWASPGAIPPSSPMTRTCGPPWRWRPMEQGEPRAGASCRWGTIEAPMSTSSRGRRQWQRRHRAACCCAPPRPTSRRPRSRGANGRLARDVAPPRALISPTAPSATAS